jgi:hypothetical protein
MWRRFKQSLGTIERIDGSARTYGDHGLHVYLSGWYLRG